MAVGRIQRRLALAIVLTALIPLVVAIGMGEWMVRQTSARFYTPEVGIHLDDALDVYQDLARAVKARMRVSALAIAGDPELEQAVLDNNLPKVNLALARLFAEHPDLLSLAVEESGEAIAERRRAREFDAEAELDLEVRVPLLDGEAAREQEAELVAVFVTQAKRFQERDQLSLFLDAYRTVEQRREEDDSGRLYAFVALLGLTILMAIGVGTSLARGVSLRIGNLAEATRKVGAGDLNTRVLEAGRDEITDLAAAFNRMVGEVESSRARIEYLQRIGAWQEMARRLAHEIKNPLTPIQLAVQEVHRRYPGEDPAYRKMLDTTLEVVEDEVGALRRLVSEFSNFARLPQADLKLTDLTEFLADLNRLPSLGEVPEADEADMEPLESERPGHWSQLLGLEGDFGVEFMLEVPKQPLPVLLDSGMFKRVLINLLRNAAQAAAAGSSESGPRVELHVKREGEFISLAVDDNGPGIPEAEQALVFDPYMTTKADGTGLGLAIVKKIVVEHGGQVRVESSPLGGARLLVRLPVALSEE